MMATSARAHLSRLGGVDEIELSVLALDSFKVYILDPDEAERLLYDLHSICTTLRGVNKPLRWRDRLRRVTSALKGH
jgi:hypothetical protein